MKLVIKGDRNAAYRAAALARVTIDNPVPTAHGEVIAWAPAADHELVVAWFCDGPFEPPYPVGTLLFYRD